MLIAFAQTGTNPLIQKFLDSVAGHELWHITDEDTPALPGCEVFRMPSLGMPFMLWRANAYAAFGKPGAYLDTDMIVQHDLSPLMALDADVLLTKQTAVYLDPNGTNLTELMPYNGGMVVCKTPRFWADVAKRMENYTPDLQKWYGDQFAMAEVAKRYDVIELPCSIYNYTPRIHEHKSGADLSAKWVLHFKGERKEWMNDYGTT